MRQRLVFTSAVLFALNAGGARAEDPSTTFTTAPTTEISVVTPAPTPAKPPVIPMLMKTSAELASSSTAVYSPPTQTKPLPGESVGNPYSLDHTNENYDALLNPANRTDFFWPLKRIPISKTDPDYYITFAAEARERYELFNNVAFGIQPQDHDGYYLTRIFTNADIHLGPDLRLFVELKSAMIDNRVGGPRPTDADEFDVDQAFGEVKLPLGKETSLSFRGGRQYLLYGAQRLVSPLDWSNTRRTFDGFKFSLVNAASPTVQNYFDAFWTRPVAVDKEEFNNDDHNSAFWGLYDTILFPKLVSEKAKTGLDLYFLGLHQRDRAALFTSPAIAASNDTYTVGTRFATSPMPWDVDAEADYQFGRTGDNGGQISAYSFAIDGGYTFAKLPLAPRINLGFDIASGDNGTDNPNRGTFNQLFPLSHSYLGYIDVVARQNVIDLHPGITFTLLQNSCIGKTVSFKAENHIFWRQNTNDALYSDPGAIERAGNLSDRRFVGDEIDLMLNYQFDAHLSGYVGYSHFFTGGFLDTTGAHSDIDFFYVAANYVF